MAIFPENGFVLPEPPASPRKSSRTAWLRRPSRPRPVELEPEWHRARYGMVASYAHVVVLRREEADGQTLLELALDLARSVVATADHLDTFGRRRRNDALLSFLARSMEPASVLLLAGSMLLAGRAPTDEPPTEPSAKIPDRARLLEMLAPDVARGYSSRELLGYVEAQESPIDRVHYNIACYWSTELDTFDGPTLIEGNQHARTVRGLNALKRAIWISSRPELFQRWARTDPSLRALRRADEAAFDELAPEPASQAQRPTRRKPPDVAARILEGEGVDLLELAAAFSSDIRVLDELGRLVEAGQIVYRDGRFSQPPPPAGRS
jgi:hypothetical protein